MKMTFTNGFKTALAATLCVGVLAVPASAGATIKAIWGPAELPAGNAFCPTAKDSCSAFPVYSQLGVNVFQFQIHWNEVAPTRPSHPRDPNDPAYHWGAIDDVVYAAANSRVGLAALLQLSPGWANGGRNATWAPDPKAFADFAYAASKRYPTIRRWMIWGEPSRAENFQPMRPESPRGPRAYAELLDRAYGALKAARRGNIVIGGMTLNGGTVKAPDFLQEMTLKNGRPPRMDLWGHNPFDARFPHLYDEPLGRFRGFNDIDTLHEEIAATYRAGHRKVPRLWLSEWTIVSDRPLTLFSGFFVSRQEQAARITTAYKIADRTPYVSGLGWFTLMDQTPADGDARWGLLQADGQPKPSFTAFKRAK